MPRPPTPPTRAPTGSTASAVSLRGVRASVKHELRHMREQGGGTIVNGSSLGGLVANPGRAAYHTTKHGVIGPTGSAALEHGSPAPVPRRLPRRHRHPMVDATVEGGGLDRAQAETGQAIDRPGTAEEAAQAVLCPCGPGSGYVNRHRPARRRRLHRPAAAHASPAGRRSVGIRLRRVRPARRARGATPWAAPRERRRRISREGYDQRPMVGDLPGVVGVGWRVPVVQN